MNNMLNGTKELNLLFSTVLQILPSQSTFSIFPEVPCLDSTASMFASRTLERWLGLEEDQRSLCEELVHLCLFPDAPPNCHGDCRLESSPAVSQLSLPAEQRTSKGYIICHLHTWGISKH